MQISWYWPKVYKNYRKKLNMFCSDSLCEHFPWINSKLLYEHNVRELQKTVYSFSHKNALWGLTSMLALFPENSEKRVYS